MSRSNVKDLLYLFDLPALPITLSRGSNDNLVYFDIPEEYFNDQHTERFRTKGRGIRRDAVHSGKPVPLLNFDRKKAPIDLTIPMKLDAEEHFSIFNDFHMKCAKYLIDSFMNAKDVEELKQVCVYTHLHDVNRFLYIYALSVAVLHREDTKNVLLPSLALIMPELFFDKRVLREARKEGALQHYDEQAVVVIPKDYTASNKDVEHKVAYFREDIGINLHHWHWHLVYPFGGDKKIVDKDRRGELFYYMHQQVMARYNVERFCNNLPRVRNFLDYRKPISEAYFPKLGTMIASHNFPSRQENTAMSHTSRVGPAISSVEDLIRWRERIFEAIHRGYIITDVPSEPLEITVENGIDLLGNLIEPSDLSKNKSYYGSLHNTGHVIISLIHDPDEKYLEKQGVMGDNTTAMRDPVFYVWHTEINRIFQEYKNTLKEYTTKELSFDGITITVLNVTTDKSNVPDTIETFWEDSIVDLTHGLDFRSPVPIHVKFTHLQHKPFTYKITVKNGGAEKEGTVRIFLGPKKDERGLDFSSFNDQKGFFIELDRFKTTLKNGQNIIERKSTESSVTIPFKQIFPTIKDCLDGDNSELEKFCGCGWPDYMLIPKGKPEGFPCELFAMITDHKEDLVNNNSMDPPADGCCDDAFSYCGIRDGKYPDRKAMGFPFDRLWPKDGNRPNTLSDFVKSNTNMNVTPICIKFSEVKKNSL